MEEINPDSYSTMRQTIERLKQCDSDTMVSILTPIRADVKKRCSAAAKRSIDSKANAIQNANQSATTYEVVQLGGLILFSTALTATLILPLAISGLAADATPTRYITGGSLFGAGLIFTAIFLGVALRGKLGYASAVQQLEMAKKAFLEVMGEDKALFEQRLKQKTDDLQGEQSRLLDLIEKRKQTRLRVKGRAIQENHEARYSAIEQRYKETKTERAQLEKELASVFTILEQYEKVAKENCVDIKKPNFSNEKSEAATDEYITETSQLNSKRAEIESKIAKLPIDMKDELERELEICEELESSMKQGVEDMYEAELAVVEQLKADLKTLRNVTYDVYWGMSAEKHNAVDAVLKSGEDNDK